MGGLIARDLPFDKMNVTLGVGKGRRAQPVRSGRPGLVSGKACSTARRTPGAGLLSQDAAESNGWYRICTFWATACPAHLQPDGIVFLKLESPRSGHNAMPQMPRQPIVVRIRCTNRVR